MIRVAWRQTPESDESWREAYRRLVGEPWRKRDVVRTTRTYGIRELAMRNGVVVLVARWTSTIVFPRGWTFGLKSLEGAR